MKTQARSIKNEPTKNEQISRLMSVKSTLGDIDYTTIYGYEFMGGKKLSDEIKNRLRNFWNYKLTDLKLLNQFEWMAENIKRIPEIAKQKSS